MWWSGEQGDTSDGFFLTITRSYWPPPGCPGYLLNPLIFFIHIPYRYTPDTSDTPDNTYNQLIYILFSCPKYKLYLGHTRTYTTVRSKESKYRNTEIEYYPSMTGPTSLGASSRAPVVPS